MKMMPCRRGAKKRTDPKDIPTFDPLMVDLLAIIPVEDSEDDREDNFLANVASYVESHNVFLANEEMVSNVHDEFDPFTAMVEVEISPTLHIIPQMVENPLVLGGSVHQVEENVDCGDERNSGGRPSDHQAANTNGYVGERRASRMVGDAGLDYEAVIYDEIIKNKKTDKEATKNKAELEAKATIDKEKGNNVHVTPNCGNNMQSSKKSKRGSSTVATRSSSRLATRGPQI
ncbi:hypothetical protein AMTRI_Chr07g29610 [Amborella trichopoda]